MLLKALVAIMRLKIIFIFPVLPFLFIAGFLRPYLIVFKHFLFSMLPQKLNLIFKFFYLWSLL